MVSALHRYNNAKAALRNGLEQEINSAFNQQQIEKERDRERVRRRDGPNAGLRSALGNNREEGR